ncbi:MAG: hypothetical protein RR500_06865 [Bacilli bacterium]
MKNKLKLNILWIFKWFIFIFIFAVLFIHISYLFRPAINDREIVAGYYAEKENSLDMVYVGGSSTFVYWAPMEAWKNHGIVSNNFAYNSISADALKSTIKEALKTQNPDLLVVDARAFQYRGEYLEEGPIRQYTDSTKYSLNRSDFIRSIVPEKFKNMQLSSLEWICDLSTYHIRWNQLDQSSWELINNEKERDIKGFYFVPKKKVIALNDNSNVTEKQPLRQDVEEIFIDLMEYCKSLDRKILFVINTYSEEPSHREIFNYLEERINSYGFDFINVNESYKKIGMDETNDYYDQNHINIYGAEKYTKFLGDYIMETYKLKDRRNDLEYKHWNDLLPNWNQQVKDNKLAIDNYVE